MQRRSIIIQTYSSKRGQPYQHNFDCQLITIGNARTYLLSETKRKLTQRHITLRYGNKVFDDGKTYFIRDIWYSPHPKYVFITVHTGFNF